MYLQLLGSPKNNVHWEQIVQQFEIINFLKETL